MTPNEWRLAPLSNAAVIIMGNSPPGVAYNAHGEGTPLLNGPADFGPLHPIASQWTTSVTRECQPGDVLFCVRGATTGRQIVADQRYCIGRGLAAIRGKAGQTDTTFLRHALRRIAAEILAEARGAGSTFPAITSDRLAQWLVLLPPLAEQCRIAAVLSAVDDAVQATSAVVDQVDLLRRQLADELFAHGLADERLHEPVHGRSGLPRSWVERPLSDVASVQTGIAKGKPVLGTSVDVPYLRVANVQDGYVDLGEMKTIRVDPGALERYSLRAGDVLFTEGGDFDKLGRGCVWRAQIAPCLHQNHVFAVRTSDALLPDFLAAYAASSRGRAYFLDCAKRTTNLASINSTQLKALPVPVAPLDQQRTIVAALSAISERLEQERAVLAQNRELKAALAEVLLTGNVRVPSPDTTDADQPVVRRA